MSEILHKRKEVKGTDYYRVFTWASDSRSGFHFPCDKDGVISLDNEDAQENLRHCLNGDYHVHDLGVRGYTYTHNEPMVVLCDCGHEVEMTNNLVNTCDHCDQGYNFDGQKLAPPSQWEPNDYYDVYGPQNRAEDD